MHPHAADFMVHDHIDALMGEATRARLARTAKRAVSGRPSWRERVLATLRGRTHRRVLGTVARRT
jgi:hypothetical protein